MSNSIVTNILAKATVEGFEAAKKEIQRLSNSAQSASEKLSNFLTHTAANLASKAISTAVKAVANGLSEAASNAAKAEQVFNKLGTVFSGFEREANKAAQSLAKSMGVATSTAADSLSTVADMLQAQGMGVEESLATATEWVTKFQDIIAFKDIDMSLDEFASSFMSGAVGNTKNFRTFGSIVKETAVNAELAAQGLDKLTGNQLELAKMTIRANMALDQQANALGAVEREWNNTLSINNRLSEAWKSFSEVIGSDINKVLDEVKIGLTDILNNAGEIYNKVKGFFSSMPEVFSKLIASFKADLSAFLRPEDFFNNILNNVTTLLRNGLKLITNAFKLVGDAIANRLILSLGIIERALEGIGNYAMAWIVKIADEAGIDISSVINSIGQWLQESPIGKIVDKILTTAINGVKVVATTIKNIPQILKIVLSHAGDMITAFFNTIPAMIDGIFKGVVNWIAYIGIHLKNNLVQSVEDAINEAVGGVRKLFHIKKSTVVDFGVDRTSENAFKEKADNAFASAGDAFAPVKAIGAEIGKEVADLINPQINEVVDTNLSLGGKMATWTAKTSDDYYEAAKQNFDSIDDFLTDWFKTFSSDIGSDFSDVLESFETLYDLPAFENMSDFVDWFKAQDWSKTTPTTPTTTTSSSSTVTVSGDDDEDDEEMKQKSLKSNQAALDAAIAAREKAAREKAAEQKENFIDSVTGTLTSSIGEAGKLISTAATNIGEMGVVAGLVATALEYVMKFLDEDTLTALENSLNPILQMLKSVAHALSPLITILTDIIQPVLEHTAAIFIWVAGNIRHAIASFINWVAGTAVGRWAEVSRVTDDGAVSWNQALAQAKRDEGLSDGKDSQTKSSIAGANYSGQTTIYLTINQNAPVVGENGMQQFAVMVRSELQSLDMYGY